MVRTDPSAIVTNRALHGLVTAPGLRSFDQSYHLARRRTAQVVIDPAPASGGPNHGPSDPD
jgi:hypothetical protein